MRVLYRFITQIRRDLSRIRAALIILIVYGTITQLIFHTFCPFAILTGFACPGCGLTRAGFSVLCGQFRIAAQWNAGIYLWIPYLLYLCFFRYALGRKIPALIPLTAAVCLGTLICYVIRWRTGSLISVPCPGLWRYLGNHSAMLLKTHFSCCIRWPVL